VVAPENRGMKLQMPACISSGPVLGHWLAGVPQGHGRRPAAWLLCHTQAVANYCASVQSSSTTKQQQRPEAQTPHQVVPIFRFPIYQSQNNAVLQQSYNQTATKARGANSTAGCSHFQISNLPIQK